MIRLEIIKERNESLHPSKRLEYDNPLDLALTWTRNYWSDTYYLLQRLERYEKALNFYGDEQNYDKWTYGVERVTNVTRDKGNVAKEALKE